MGERLSAQLLGSVRLKEAEDVGLISSLPPHRTARLKIILCLMLCMKIKETKKESGPGS